VKYVYPIRPISQYIYAYHFVGVLLWVPNGRKIYCPLVCDDMYFSNIVTWLSEWRQVLDRLLDLSDAFTARDYTL
jgi:hypothetical protein